MPLVVSDSSGSVALHHDPLESTPAHDDPLSSSRSNFGFAMSSSGAVVQLERRRSNRKRSRSPAEAEPYAKSVRSTEFQLYRNGKRKSSDLFSQQRLILFRFQVRLSEGEIRAFEIHPGGSPQTHGLSGNGYRPVRFI